MSIVFEERLSDSPYVETVTQGYMACDGSTIRPAELRWHMVFVSYQGTLMPLVVGPLTSAGVVSYVEGAELLWIKFRLGAYMPHLPVRDCLNSETALPDAARRSFWLKGSAWQFPDYSNVETFVARLVREDVLVRDPVVDAALQDHPQALSARTLRHRFMHTTGLTQIHIRQVERAQQAAARLQRGQSILDTVYELGYFDQPHLTKSLKQFVGYTPAQLLRAQAG